MSGTAGLAFPAGSTLAGWWRQLATLQPRAWWVAHLFVHRVEVLVRVAAARPLEPLESLLLKSAAVDAGTRMRTIPLGGLAARFYHELAELDLVRAGASGWSLSQAGAAALASGELIVPHEERRVFSFAERLDPAGRRSAPPMYLPLAPLPARPWQPPDACAFDLAFLDQAIGQPTSWKVPLQFPTDIVGRASNAAGDWSRTTVVRPEHHLAVILELPQSQWPLQAFPIRSETMTPATAVPLFVLAATAMALLGDMLPEPAGGLPISGDEFQLIGEEMVRAVGRRG